MEEFVDVMHLLPPHSWEIMIPDISLPSKALVPGHMRSLWEGKAHVRISYPLLIFILSLAKDKTLPSSLLSISRKNNFLMLQPSLSSSVHSPDTVIVWPHQSLPLPNVSPWSYCSPWFSLQLLNLCPKILISILDTLCVETGHLFSTHHSYLLFCLYPSGLFSVPLLAVITWFFLWFTVIVCGRGEEEEEDVKLNTPQTQKKNQAH